MSKREVQNTAIQLMMLFFLIYLVMNVVATLYYLIQGYEVYGSPTKNDSVYYHYKATLIAQTGDFSIVNLPYEYLVGAIYYIFGVTLGPYAFKIFISLIASFNIYLVILIVGKISLENRVEKTQFTKWSKIISIMIILYPTYLLFTLNMVRDIFIVFGSLIFVYTFLNLFIYDSSRKVKHYLYFLVSILGVFVLRPYFGVMMVATLLIYYFSEKRFLKLKYFIILIIVMLAIGTLMGFSKFGFFGINYLKGYANLDTLSNYREGSGRGTLALNININFKNPLEFLYSYSYAFIVNHIYPFPRYFGTYSLLFIPENLFVSYALIKVLRKLNQLLKYKEMKFLLIYYFLNVGLIVGFSDNIGTNIRLRITFIICLMIMLFIAKLNHQKKKEY